MYRIKLYCIVTDFFEALEPLDHLAKEVSQNDHFPILPFVPPLLLDAGPFRVLNMFQKIRDCCQLMLIDRNDSLFLVLTQLADGKCPEIFTGSIAECQRYLRGMIVSIHPSDGDFLHASGYIKKMVDRCKVGDCVDLVSTHAISSYYESGR